MNEKTKALFFSQYIGQQVEYLGLVGELSFDRPCIEVNVTGHRFINEACLLLRTVYQLSDEEKKIINGFSAYAVTDKNKNKIAESMLRHLFEFNTWSGNTIIQIFSYLRAIGILLPFTYIDENNKPVTLSTDEIIKLGWANVSLDPITQVK